MTLLLFGRAGRMAAAVIAACFASASDARAEADGPDFYRVDGIEIGQTIAVRASPSESAAQVGELEANSATLVNLGCTGGADIATWLKMSESERQTARNSRWCKIGHGRVEGWVPGRYLVEDTGLAPE